MSRIIEGSVLRLECAACRREIWHFSLFGDSDVATSGLYSASSVSKKEVVVAEAEAEEWDRDDGDAFARRLNDELQRNDLVFVRLLRVEEHSEMHPGELPIDFMNRYRRPTLYFSCPHCADGESTVVEELEPSEFRAAGGAINLVGDLELRELPRSHL